MGWNDGAVMDDNNPGESFSGEEHERYARKLDTLRDFAAYDYEDSGIARLGERGVEIYEPKLKKALVEARQAAVRGTQHF